MSRLSAPQPPTPLPSVGPDAGTLVFDFSDGNHRTVPGSGRSFRINHDVPLPRLEPTAPAPIRDAAGRVVEDPLGYLREWPGEGGERDSYGGVPLPRDLLSLSYFLASRGYSEAERGAILRHTAVWGSTCGAPFLREEDRDQAERTAPWRSDLWKNPTWDEVRFGLGPGSGAR